MATCPQLIESIDSSFLYIKWDWESREIINSIQLFSQNASYLVEEIAILGTIFCNRIFLATTTGCIRAFEIKNSSLIEKIAIDDSMITYNISGDSSFT